MIRGGGEAKFRKVLSGDEHRRPYGDHNHGGDWQWEVVSGHRGGGTGSLEPGERISASVADAVVA